MYKSTLKVTVEGVDMELYTVGYTAKMMKRSVETLRAWERNKTIPPPMFRYKNNVRLYHQKEVDAMKRVLRKLGRYARREKLKDEMWKALAEARKEIMEHVKAQG